MDKIEEDDILEPEARSDIQSITSAKPDQPSVLIPKHLQFPPEKNREERICDFLLPYQVESVAEMDEKLETIIKHLIECANGKDFQFGFLYWNGLLEDWLELRYPMKRRVRARLGAFYYNLACTPGMETRVTESVIKMAVVLIKSSRLDIRELQLEWEPLYQLIETELFPKQRATGVSTVYTSLLALAEVSNPYYPPHTAGAILERFLPLLDGSDFNSVLATQSLLGLFLPLQNPRPWLPSIFRLWATFQSQHWDEQWLELLSRLSVKHVDPASSDPRLADLIEAVTAGESYADAVRRIVDFKEESPPWAGVQKDVGIYTTKQYAFIMSQCVRCFEVPLGFKYSQVASYGAVEADSKISPRLQGIVKPSDPLESLSTIIVYSMYEDPEASESRAIASLSRLLTAMETFFHPSNHGEWSSKLAKFLRHLAWQFARRWSAEAKIDCPTPGEWRLTARIKKQFVGLLSQYLLMSMFSRDGTTSAMTQQALKVAASLEPTVMIPPIVELSVAALEGLLETHRTTACLAALSAIIGSMLNSTLYPSGARNLPTILDLLLPGIDPSDPSKTMHSAMLVLLALSKIKISNTMPSDNAQGILNLERPAIDDAEPSAQQDIPFDETEPSTFLSDWALTYFRRVLSFFENLPEPHGTKEKTGGKVEESTISFLVASFDELCKATAPELFPTMLDFFKDYICDNIRFNMVKTVGLIASSLARGFADPVTIRTLYPLCDRKIKAELEAGASSIHTMSTGTHKSSDLALHWFLTILIGITTSSGPFLLEFRDDILSLLKLLIQECKTEKGYAYTARLIYAILRALLETYPDENRFVNPEEWNSAAMQNSHQFAWGKAYKVTDVKISWHVASHAEIDFAMSILEDILVPIIENIKQILSRPALDHDTKCEFVKLCTIAKSTVSGIAALAIATPPINPGKQTSDWGESVPNVPEDLPVYKTGMPLSPNDPRHMRVREIREAVAEMLHLAVVQLKVFEDTIECVQSILGLMSSLLLDYPFERGIYDYHKESYKFSQTLARVTKFQKEYPRIVWLRRAQLLHFIRLKTLTVTLRRSQTDDQLIHDLSQFCVSSWVAIRKSAQRSLEAICQLYDGTRAIVLPSFLQCLDPGTEPDKMKGALYVLGGKSFPRFCLLRPEYSATYVLRLLQCQHCEKSSIQALVSGLLYHHTIRMYETATLHNSLVSVGTPKAIENLERELFTHSVDPASSAVIAKRVSEQIRRRDECQKSLVADLLKIAREPSTHWKYSQNASRLLKNLIRRDQPLDPQTTLYFINELCESDLPAKRSHGIVAITKILHFIKLRTMAGGSSEVLLAGKPTNPLHITVRVPSPCDEDFEKFSTVVATPMKASPQFLLDKLTTGWLVCGDLKAYRPPPDTEVVVWDSTSEETLSIFRASLSQESFWKKLAAHLSQEQSRDYLSLSSISIFQIFRQDFWPIVLPTLEALIEDTLDRHKQRAAGEIIGGALRATKHWSLQAQNVLWGWFESRLKSIYDSITPDSLGSWVMCVDYLLLGRDPRRNQVLVDFILALETESHSSAFDASKAHQFIGSLIRSITWPFMQPPIEMYWDVYWRAIDHDYLEVRNCVSSNLQSLTEVQASPSFPSVTAFLKACQDPALDDKPLSIDSPLTIAAIEKLLEDLRRARETRLPAQHGDQEYDRCSTTILSWLWSSLTDFLLPVIYPFIPRIIPELVYMHEMTDNKELSLQAHTVVLTLSCVVYPQDLADAFLAILLDLSKTKRWKVRLDVLSILRAFFFHQLQSLSRQKVDEILQSLCILLGDSSPEVREAASGTLCAIVHCSERASILQLKSRFTQILRETPLPKLRFENGVERAGYQATIIKIHSAVLGSAALVNAFPYDVPAWVPEVLINNICSHMSSPTMISTTARNTLRMFKKTHQDTWIEGQKAFSPEELATLNDYLVGSSYYA
ncbi:hypothetical protein CROQUDRAFT_673152 [Cronartium quercuum f. sp. fusiforme G11]|uniref:Proteasome activator subunit 4 n=1 Tax=Cronartium quercuum f. sp. fusiforme G11 TaxID=708437 RepID=A0A9P6T916_9BASI|nr:hypothetical protein CROQUDRAFT_673152 [Cronartium quercuum f. sp. fusiforme G11]